LLTKKAYNLVTQHDSHIMKRDSKSMKIIAAITVAFLPLATVAVSNFDFLPCCFSYFPMTFLHSFHALSFSDEQTDEY